MNIDDCIREGFLKLVKSNKDEIEKELKESKNDLENARMSFESENYKWSIIQCYYSMFHSARAVLFSLGYKERRHFAINIVLEHLVKSKKIESFVVDDFKAAMFAREEADYDGNYSRERAENILTIAEEFNGKMKNLLKHKK